MKKILFILALILSLSVSAQNYNPDQKYGFWSNWTIGGNIEIVDGPTSGFDGGLGVDLQFTKRLSQHWTMRLTGSVPSIYKFDSMFNRYALASLGVMYFPFGEHLYVATDAGASTLVDSKFHAFFTSTVSLGYHFIIKDVHIINLEAGCNYRHSVPGIDGGADHFVRVGYAYSFGPTKVDKQIAEQKAQIIADGENAMTKNAVLISDIKTHINRLSELEDINKYLMDTINHLEDSIIYLNGVIDSLIVAIDGMESYISAPTVVFDCNSYTISSDQNRYLDFMADLVKSCDDTVYVWGFADSQTGTKEYNQSLSEKRANSLKNALVKRGCNASLIDAIGKGWDISYGDSNSAASRKAILIMSTKNEDNE